MSCYWMANHQRNKVTLSQVSDHGPKIQYKSEPHARKSVLFTKRDSGISCFHEDNRHHHKDLPPYKNRWHVTVVPVDSENKPRFPSIQDYKLLDFNTTPKFTNPLFSVDAVSKTQKQGYLAFWTCIMTVLMTIYTDSVLSNTGVFTIEVVSVCVDITVCAESDWARESQHILADVA